MVINKKKLLPVIIISILLIITIIFSIKITIKDSNNMLTSKKTYGNIKIDDFDNNRTNLYDVEQDILNYILEKNDIDKNMVKNVEYLFYNKECKYKPTLKIELDEYFKLYGEIVLVAQRIEDGKVQGYNIYFLK